MALAIRAGIPALSARPVVARSSATRPVSRISAVKPMQVVAPSTAFVANAGALRAAVPAPARKTSAVGTTAQLAAADKSINYVIAAGYLALSVSLLAMPQFMIGLLTLVEANATSVALTYMTRCVGVLGLAVGGGACALGSSWNHVLAKSMFLQGVVGTLTAALTGSGVLTTAGYAVMVGSSVVCAGFYLYQSLALKSK